MAADLQAVGGWAEMVGVVDGPGGQPDDLAFQVGQDRFSGVHEVFWRRRRKVFSFKKKKQ